MNDKAPSRFTRPLVGYRIVCAGRGGRATLHCARMLADLGADVLYVDNTVDELGRLLLDRAPAVRSLAVEGVTASDLENVFALVHEGIAPATFNQHVIPADANRIALDWFVRDGATGTDEGAQAMAGAACAVGERDRAPLWFPFRMGEYVQGVNACGLLLLFALGSRKSAVGEIALADIWGYAAGTMRMLCEPKGIRYFRDGRRSPGNGGVYPQRLFEAKDGFITLLCRSAKEWSAILQAFDHPAWGENPRYRDILAMARDYPDEVDALVEAETRRFTQAQLYSRAIDAGIPLAPVRSPLQAMADETLAQQHFWSSSHGLKLPGSLWRAETFITAEPDARIAAAPAATQRGKANLSGYRVLDLSWVWAGPMVGSMLADLGAEVIKVEHSKRLDNMRLRGKLPSAIPDAHRNIDPRETDPLFHNVNRGKRSLLLDMKAEAGRKLFLDLVAKSDIVLESFRPHVLESWGLGYEQLKAANPRIVLLSLRGLELDETGSTGLRSYAPITSSLCGLESQIRYADATDPTGGMAIGISDPVAGWHGFTLLMGALLNTRRTGVGSWIRLSQLETLSSTLSEMYLLAQQPELAPRSATSKAVRCADADVIVSATESVWEKLLAQGAVKQSSPDLSAATAAELTFAVAAAGGQTWPVMNIDIQDRWSTVFGRPLMSPVTHSLCGKEELLTHGWTIDGEPIIPHSSAPTIGADTNAVLREWLSLTDQQIEDYRARRVLS